MTAFEKGFIKQASLQGISKIEASRLLKEAGLFSDNWFTHGATALGNTVADMWKHTGKSFGQHYNTSVDNTAGANANKLFSQYKNYADPASFSRWQKLRSWMGHDYTRDAEIAKTQMGIQSNRRHTFEPINDLNGQVKAFDAGLAKRYEQSALAQDKLELVRANSSQIHNKPVPQMQPIHSELHTGVVPVNSPTPIPAFDGGRRPLRIPQY